MNTVRRVMVAPTATASDRRRRVAAFVVAAMSDLISLGDWMFPPVQIVVDVATALLLWMLLGWRWPLLPAFIAEAIPGLELFPTWTLVAGAYLIYPRRPPAAENVQGSAPVLEGNPPKRIS